MTILTLAAAVAWQTAAPHFITPGMDFARALELIGEPPAPHDFRNRPIDVDVRFYHFPRTGVTLRVDHVAVGLRVREVRWESPRPGFTVRQPAISVPPEGAVPPELK